MIVMCEMIRMGMKMHAYLRNKLLFCSQDFSKYRYFIPTFAGKLGITEKDLVDPKIDLKDSLTEVLRYMFFFFCPTLIYRDNYIKSPNRNYRKMFEHFFNFVLCIYFGFVLFKTFCKPQIHIFFKNFCID
jgi:sterol O-acyltransferase